MEKRIGGLFFSVNNDTGAVNEHILGGYLYGKLKC